MEKSHRVITSVLFPHIDVQATAFLWFTSHVIIIHSNKSTNQMQQIFKFITCRLSTAQQVSGVLMPIIGSSTTAVVASGFTVGTWW
jgi:hypothetical protein